MHLVEVIKTETFGTWIDGLRDRQAKVRILTRIARLASGNAGDVKPVGSGVSEMRIPYGPGYRVYFTNNGKAVVILLCGGDKSSQQKDIALAIRLKERL